MFLYERITIGMFDNKYMDLLHKKVAIDSISIINKSQQQKPGDHMPTNLKSIKWKINAAYVRRLNNGSENIELALIGKYLQWIILRWGLKSKKVQWVPVDDYLKVNRWIVCWLLWDCFYKSCDIDSAVLIRIEYADIRYE